jgi:hypothetical protein
MISPSRQVTALLDRDVIGFVISSRASRTEAHPSCKEPGDLTRSPDRNRTEPQPSCRQPGELARSPDRKMIDQIARSPRSPDRPDP